MYRGKNNVSLIFPVPKMVPSKVVCHIVTVHIDIQKIIPFTFIVSESYFPFTLLCQRTFSASYAIHSSPAFTDNSLCDLGQTTSSHSHII